MREAKAARAEVTSKRCSSTTCRVPGNNLVGGENNGWKVANTHLEIEHGVGGRIGGNQVRDLLFDYCKNTQRNGHTLSQDPEVRSLMVDAYIDWEILRLFNLRNYWMRHARQQVTYHGSQASYFRKMSGLRIGKAILELLGPYALTNDEEWGPCGGHMEAHQRSSIVAVHPWRNG